MHILDWLIIACPVLIVFAVGVYTQRYMKSVAHFVSGGRLGGRYLLAVAKGEMQAGAVVFVAAWEVFARAGFVPSWWAWMSTPVIIIVAIFGFVIYRFRESRALTLAQFFEIRYSRNLRLFTGALGFLAGVLNFGIIPAVGARFMVYFLQLPPVVHLGTFAVPTYVLLMGAFLTVSLILTISGGLVTLMVTDCLEGIFSQLLYLVIIAGVLFVVGWSHMETVLGNRPPDYSLVNPFDAWKVQDFNLWYALMAMFVGVYGTMAWQNAGAYNSAASSPHESRMGGLLGRWRESGKAVVVVLLAAGGIAFMQHPDFAMQSAAAHQTISEIANPQLQKQMEIPVALSHLLPIGIKGALCAILLMGIFGGDSTHLHSWGSILAQDVILPFAKRAPSPEQHIKLLRYCTIFVALFAFGFGVLFTQTEFIHMWWQVTIGFYVGGTGAAIIGGLYWKKGTTAGAWAGVILGSGLTGGGILLSKWIGPTFPLNGMQISFYSTLVALGSYVLVSLLTCKRDFDLDAMLHRDPHAIRPRLKLTWARVIGFDEHFSRGDKWIVGSLFGWSMLWFTVFLIGTVWNLIAPWPTFVWTRFWHITGVGLPILISIATGIWFTWGGLRDIRALFKALRHAKVDVTDNGRVAHPAPAHVSHSTPSAMAVAAGASPDAKSAAKL
jgi:SSS family solute:Na+ symporter